MTTRKKRELTLVDIQIKSGIPVPQVSRPYMMRSPVTLAFLHMKAGDCFDLPRDFNRSSVYQSARAARAKVKIREVPDENNKLVIRVWKVGLRDARAARKALGLKSRANDKSA